MATRPGEHRSLLKRWPRRHAISSTVTSLLMATGLGRLVGDATAKGVEPASCLATAQRCGYRKRKKDGSREHRPCSRCCTRYSSVREDGKRACACIPSGDPSDTPPPVPCVDDAQCCAGVCGDGVCRFQPCAELGQPCNSTATGPFCCTGTGGCNAAVGQSGVCVTCLPSDSPCSEADLLHPCCGFCDGGTCTDRIRPPA